MRLMNFWQRIHPIPRGPGSITLTSPDGFSSGSVADCSRAGLDYTRPRQNPLTRPNPAW